MKTVTISEATEDWTRLLDLVKASETVIITDQDVPVAKLEPIQHPTEGEAHGRLERLIRAGIVRGPVKPLPKDWFKTYPRIDVPGADVLKALLEERDESR